ncbi:MAG: hypothetical protein KDA52_15210 [Planctomycetaceae bacterium]|nr:hypothetical protein [Planctomycetaceae bacterium]
MSHVDREWTSPVSLGDASRLTVDFMMPIHVTVLLQRLFLIVVCLFTTIVSTTRAEHFPLTDVVPETAPEEQRDAVQARAQQLADAMYDELLLRLDEVDRVCELSESQERQLTIAAKGVVQQGVDEWLSILSSLQTIKNVDGENRIQMGRAFLHFDKLVLRRPGPMQGMNGLKITFNKNKVNAEGLEDIIVEINADSLNEEPPLLNAEEHDLWTETLDRTLSDQQKQLYAEAEDERAALPSEWRHERVMIEFDKMLRLDHTQRGRISERVTNFLEMSQIKLWLKRRQGFDDEALAHMALRAIPTADVKDILSPRQLAQWQLILQEDLESR